MSTRREKKALSLQVNAIKIANAKLFRVTQKRN